MVNSLWLQKDSYCRDRNRVSLSTTVRITRQRNYIWQRVPAAITRQHSWVFQYKFLLHQIQKIKESWYGAEARAYMRSIENTSWESFERSWRAHGSRRGGGLSQPLSCNRGMVILMLKSPFVAVSIHLKVFYFGECNCGFNDAISGPNHRCHNFCITERIRLWWVQHRF